jgi:KTSC domain-containing protein
MAESSKAKQLWQAAYDSDSQRLVLTFPNGRSYSYEAVPPDLYRQWQEAESKGDFYNNFIRGIY